MFRPGRVSSIDADKHTARVQLFEVDGEVTADLPVLVRGKGDYWLPAKDDLVLCAMDPGSSGIGYVLGGLYSEADAPPLKDAGQRSVAGDDLRLGAPDAKDKIALAPPVKDNFDKLKEHFSALEQVISGPPIPEPGNGSPSAFQTALQAVLAASAYPDPGDVASEKVSAK
jgi:hypothetical protein